MEESATRRVEIDAQLDELSRQFRPALARFFGKRVSEKADVEDLVQEVFSRLAGRRRGEGIESPQTYLMQAAANVWRDWLRKRGTQRMALHDPYDEALDTREVFSPEHVLEVRQSVRPVLEAISELTESTRQVFVLCRIEGMKYAEAARHLGISVSAVEKHMMKAIAHLAKRLGEP